VVRIDPGKDHLKFTHGLERIAGTQPHALLEGVKRSDHAYFVHSFQLQDRERRNPARHQPTMAAITAVIGRDNLSARNSILKRARRRACA